MHHQGILIQSEPIEKKPCTESTNLGIRLFDLFLLLLSDFPNLFLLFSHVTMGSPSGVDVTEVADAQNLSFSGHLTVDGVPARRSRAPAMSGSVAAFVSSDTFKTPVCVRYLRKFRAV